MKQEVVPIVFAVDDNYIFQAAVAIESLLDKGLQVQKVQVFILTSGRLSQKGLNLFNVVQQKYSYCNIKILTIDERVFSDVKRQIARVSDATLYRLLLPNILLGYKRCIYLDADILVMGDISELLSVDMSEMYLAGVVDREVQKMDKHAEEIGLPDLNGYINAGVLVMNLELLRLHGKEDEFLMLAKQGYYFGDQDVLNISCYGKIHFLPMEYNYFVEYPDRDVTIRILHFAGGRIDRPWLNIKARDAEIWWDFASVFKKSSVYQRLYGNLQESAKLKSFRHVMDVCKGYQSIYIWGYTRHGRGLLDGLLRNNINQVVGFIDGEINKQGSVYRECEVFSVDAVSDRQECLVINAAQTNRDEVNNILLQKGFAKENILQYYIKTAEYFQVLSDKYFEDEFKEYLLMEYGIHR